MRGDEDAEGCWREKKRELVGRKEGALGYGMVGDRGKGGWGRVEGGGCVEKGIGGNGFRQGRAELKRVVKAGDGAKKGMGVGESEGNTGSGSNLEELTL